MKTNYYFLASILPPLQIGQPPEISDLELQNLTQVNVTHRSDWEKVWGFRLYYDIQNIRSLWREEPLNIHGNYDENELEEQLLVKSGFPGYVFDYLEAHETDGDRLRHFSFLLSSYFNEEIAKSSGFLKKYYSFERDLRLVLLGLRAKRLGWNLMNELQYEDPHDDLVAQMIAQKDSPDYEPPEEYADIKALFAEHAHDPLQLYQLIGEFRFQKINELLAIDLFSIDRIIAYIAQLIIVEKWVELDKKKGMEIVDTIVKEAS